MHRMLVGVELGREVHSTRTLTDNICADEGTCTRSTIDLLNTNLRNFQSNPLGLQSDSTSTNGIVGVYAGDQIAILDNLHLNAGGRFDIFKQEIVNRDSSTTPGGSRNEKTDYGFSPSIGLTYQVIKPVALFVNYTNSFSPQGGFRTVQGTLLDPERGRQYEAGVKFQTEDGRLRSTVAIFDIKKKNVATSDPADRLFQIGIGEQRSRGADFDIAGRILPGWDIIANYAYVDARVTKDEDFLIGSRLPNVPLHQGSIWTTYFVQEGQLQGLGAGLGMYAQAKRNAVLQFPVDPAFGDNQVDLPGFVRMDAALYYRKNEIFPHTNLIASLNLRNILGQRYFEGGQFREVIYPGAPLTVLAAIKLEFF
jgi:iron complex outermembrane recepter protein